ncbi:hypothetical protein [Actinomadura hibisca]|uniref:hypothetical protein n=1 Tax=Actinomadura hibisca TaxID=68565 RepID=UPI000835278E|nr:hypothetical protein [Actinomadura hibisca]
MQFHYVITVAYPERGGAVTATYNGHFKPRPGMTHKDLYEAVTAYVRSRLGVGPAVQLNTLFFTIAPNEVPGITNAVA